MKLLKLHWKSLLLCLAIPLAVGGLSALLSGGGMRSFSSMNQPPLSPPAWLFPVVWTILYLAMGFASWLVWVEKSDPGRNAALGWYGLQLGFNFFWSILFFRFSMYLFAFFWLCALWLLIAVTLGLFAKIRRAAGLLLVPYLLWVAFAGYLNFWIFLLNP